MAEGESAEKHLLNMSELCDRLAVMGTACARGVSAIDDSCESSFELHRHRPDARVPGGKIRSVPRDKHHNGRRRPETEQWRP